LDVCAASTLATGIAEAVDIPANADPRTMDAVKKIVAKFFNSLLLVRAFVVRMRYG
jgi:hypothetical protein